MTVRLRGLTWDHPRAVRPLAAAERILKRLHPSVELEWEVQPLSGFESRSIEEAARGYDLLIFDHPHVGEARAHAALTPLDEVLAAASLADADFMGPSLASYRWEGSVWGLPLDAACQVSCARPDLLGSLGVQRPPLRWSEVIELGERARSRGLHLCCGLGGVHALMCLLTLCANQGAPLVEEPRRSIMDRGAARRSLEALAALASLCPPEALDWSSIDVQEAMCARNDLIFCPLVFGFASYSSIRRAVRLEYGPLPGLDGQTGSTLGGAGIGISAHSPHAEEALAIAVTLIGEALQIDLIPSEEGQPGRREAWYVHEVDERAGGFYSGTRATLERAWIRPRFNGYMSFQRAGGPVVEHYLRGRTDADDALDQLEREWRMALAQ